MSALTFWKIAMTGREGTPMGADEQWPSRELHFKSTNPNQNDREASGCDEHVVDTVLRTASQMRGRIGCTHSRNERTSK